MEVIQSKLTSEDEFNDRIIKKFLNNQLIREKISEKGLIHIDRQLPFFLVYRSPLSRKDFGTKSLLHGESSYLFFPRNSQEPINPNTLINLLEEAAISIFGASLTIEIWTSPVDQKKKDLEDSKCTFKIFHSDGINIDLISHLILKMKGLPGPINIISENTDSFHPPGLEPLLHPGNNSKLSFRIGIEIPPFYQDEVSKGVFPLDLQNFRRQFGLALKQFIFQFTRSKTSHFPKNYHALGRKNISKTVLLIDRQLSDISNSFDFLINVTPTNTEEAWRSFQENKLKTMPKFSYRRLPIDPSLVKRNLHKIYFEKVRDPAVAMIFREKRDDLDRKLTMLNDRSQKKFIYGSLQLFSGVPKDLLHTAKKILESCKSKINKKATDILDAKGISIAAEKEILFYKSKHAFFSAKTIIRDDIEGLIVSKGDFLIGRHAAVEKNRIEATIAHEVGTHLVTHYNGLLQPLKIISSGLAGYDELQEGIAVLSEYLVGKLTYKRLKVLAGRVLAVDHLLRGDSFEELYQILVEHHKFSPKSAFVISMRVFRGGGLTKDTVYLSGLLKTIDYLRAGGDINILFIGKINSTHIPLIRELQWREVSPPPPLTPRYMSDPEAMLRLQKIIQCDDPIETLLGAAK